MSHTHCLPCFLKDPDKNVNCVRGSPNNYFCKIILKSNHWLIFYDFFFNQLPWQPEFCRDLNYFTYFKKGPPKKHCYQFIMKCVSTFRQEDF